MKVLKVNPIPNSNDEEWEIELTKEEREKIKQAKGWQRLTNKRIQSWFLETLENTIEKEK